jgi:Tfp pilus assembly protein PilV
MQRGVVLLEVLVSLLLFSFLALGSVKLIYSFTQTTQQNTQALTTLLVLESTQLFIRNNQNTHKLLFQNNALYYEGELLLDNVSKYEITKVGTIATIDICIDQDKVCQQWKIKEDI